MRESVCGEAGVEISDSVMSPHSQRLSAQVYSQGGTGPSDRGSQRQLDTEHIYLCVKLPSSLCKERLSHYTALS